MGFQKGSGGRTPLMGSGVSKGHSGRRPHFGRSPAGLQKIPGGAPCTPPLGAPPKACRGAASTILKRPAPVAALRPPEGFLKKPFWGAVASREPPEPPPCRLHRGSHGGGPERTTWRETSGEHCKSSFTCWVYDSPGYCRPSLGLGNTARADHLERDVWGALQIEHYVLGP